MKRIFVGLTAILALASTRVWAQDVDVVVDAAAKTFLAANPQSAGVSIAVVRGDRTRFYNYGVANRTGHVPMTSETLFPIASVTKTFTGTLLADAQLEGKLRLDDDIRTYLDGNYPNLESGGRAIHIADLVDHRSGLPFFIPDVPESQPDFKSPDSKNDEPWLTRIGRLEAGYSRDDFYADLHKVALPGPPGKDFHYSNAGAMLASYILERVYGQSYETLVTDKILKPLGMEHTRLTLTAQEEALVAKGYDGDGRVMPSGNVVFLGAGALKSTARDIVRFVRWEMAESEPAVILSHQSQTGPGAYAAGLNWQMLTSNDRRVIWQTGNIEGYNTYCITEPELKTGLVVFFNEADPKSNPAQGEMVNAILKGLDTKAVLLP